MRIASLVAIGALAASPAWPDTRTGEIEGPAFHWRPALLQSAAFLGIQHGFRFATEEGTRADMKGPFFRDWFRSVKGVSGWGDGDPFIVNYVGHPMMGAVTGLIQVQNDARGRVATFGASREYFKSRLRAFGWAALYSAQFELGPVSEASLGNVGLRPETSGFVDLVTTPTAGIGLLAAEDAVDRYLIVPLERKSRNVVWRMVVRSVLNPDRAFANALRFKPPWHRDNRAGILKP
ncbi:MAG: hypothetical protein ACE15B_09380 [Bryobacteraceae bacterium]